MSKEETKRAINKSCEFYVWLIGKGVGCDYSIACNESLRPLWAKDLEHAKQEVAVIVDEYAEPEIEDAVIIQASHLHVFEIDEHRAQVTERLQQKAQEEREAEERAEFDRLKAKFGDKDE